MRRGLDEMRPCAILGQETRVRDAGLGSGSMRMVLASCGVCLAFVAASSFGEWLSLQPLHHDPVGASMVSGGLFTIAIAVLIGD